MINGGPIRRWTYVDHRNEPTGSVWAPSSTSGQQACSEGDVELGVDVDALVLGHDEEADPAAETVVVLLVDLGAREVERARLAVAPGLLGQVLPSRPRGDVVRR